MLTMIIEVFASNVDFITPLDKNQLQLSLEKMGAVEKISTKIDIELLAEISTCNNQL